MEKQWKNKGINHPINNPKSDQQNLSLNELYKMPEILLIYTFNFYITEKAFSLGNFVSISGYKTSQSDPKYRVKIKIMVEISCSYS